MKNLILKVSQFKIPIKTRNTVTANEILKKLPLSGAGHKWGKEYYFYTSLNIEIEKKAKEVITKGEIAYWPSGNAIAIGYGPTPISIKNEIRLADKCNIWADTNVDLEILENVKGNVTISIENIL